MTGRLLRRVLPPQDEQGETELWRAVRRLEPLDPAYVSVTDGAGGPHRDRTIRTTARIATTDLCARLLQEGVRNLHVYPLDRSAAPAELVSRFGLARRPVGAAPVSGSAA